MKLKFGFSTDDKKIALHIKEQDIPYRNSQIIRKYITVAGKKVSVHINTYSTPELRCYHNMDNNISGIEIFLAGTSIGKLKSSKIRLDNHRELVLFLYIALNGMLSFSEEKM